ncbi:MAG: cytochrome PufQ [Rhodobacter sp.]|nr:cytochrome PufQ [Rhodobacter sp.]
MTDITPDMPVQVRSHVPPKREYCVYFGLIFLATLPLATLTWALQAGRTLSVPERGPVARAWSQARIITPMIFAA